jgi:hypothetical protein
MFRPMAIPEYMLPLALFLNGPSTVFTPFDLGGRRPARGWLTWPCHSSTGSSNWCETTLDGKAFTKDAEILVLPYQLAVPRSRSGPPGFT